MSLVVEDWPVARLIPYARNPRKNDHAVERMCGAIREFGFRIPIVARSDGTVIDGHLRLKAAQRLGLASVPVVLADDLSAAQIKAFRLLANRSAAWAEWDDELLTLELDELRDDGFDLTLTGFDDSELDRLLAAPAPAGLTDPDEVPERPAVPVSRPGDLWCLGAHRLLCGDATSATDVARLLGGVVPTLMVTDPPYGVAYDPDWRNRANWTEGPVARARATGKVSNDDRADWREAWALFPGDVAYVWHGGRHAHVVGVSLEASGFAIRAQIVWVKPHFVISRGDYHWQHEPCWYAVRKGRTGHWAGDRKQTTVWEIANHGAFGGKKDDADTPHGTQKPVECMRRPIENNSSPGQAIYDPFVGSGTTIIAAETAGRVCLALDLDPAYADVAVRRWQDFTGQAATLDGDGRRFEDLAAERKANDGGA